MSGESPSILPGWTGSKRILAAPNCLLRSSLFAATRPSSDKFVREMKICSISGVDIKYTGLLLTQTDLDVWHGILMIAREQKAPEFVDMSVKPFLKMIERQTGKAERDWLKSSLTKLKTAAIEVTSKDVTYVGSLIDEYYRQESTGHLAIKVNQKLAELFAPNSWTAIDWNQRSCLQRKALAQWIHAFYSTHRAPFPIRVATIMKMCGSKHKELRMFRRALREALSEVASVTGWVCRIDKSSDKVMVSRTAHEELGGYQSQFGGM